MTAQTFNDNPFMIERRNSMWVMVAPNGKCIRTFGQPDIMGSPADKLAMDEASAFAKRQNAKYRKFHGKA
jgi:hypothetical protein